MATGRLTIAFSLRRVTWILISHARTCRICRTTATTVAAARPSRAVGNPRRRAIGRNHGVRGRVVCSANVSVGSRTCRLRHQCLRPTTCCNCRRTAIRNATKCRVVLSSQKNRSFYANRLHETVKYHNRRRACMDRKLVGHRRIDCGIPGSGAQHSSQNGC